MALALSGDEEYQQYIVVHQFGHALGLDHEHQMNHIASALDETTTIKWLMVACELTESEAVDKFQADCQHCNYECIPDEEMVFDPGSIMCYP